MKLPLLFILSASLFLSLLQRPSNCQQPYINNTQLDCTDNPSISKGYHCNGPENSCRAFVTFRSQPPYDTPLSIAYLLGAEASNIVSINNISNLDDKIPTDKLIIVPVSCSCAGNMYQHVTPYTVNKDSQTYFLIANNTYQGLTTCQALKGINYYDDENLSSGTKIMVPLRCACPSENQTSNGMKSLLSYMVTWGDAVSSIAKVFGASVESVLEANMLSDNSMIFPFTPILVPLRNQFSENCSANPENSICKCSHGYHGEWNSEGLKCIKDGKKFPVKLVTLLGVCIGVGLVCLLISGYKTYLILRKRRHRLCREKYFKQNGGFLLQQKLSSCGSSVKTKIFTAEELEKATDNFCQSRFLGEGGYGTVYKGMLLDGSIVAIKRSKAIDQSWIEQFINEVVILSQINHRNIVKLFGCCLETEVPLLVYEFIPNNTLYHHIHKKDLESSLSWENRFKIACEVAGAVAYMHSAASIPIFHRDIKSSNILLDDNYNAKVSDFGTSRSVPHGKTHLTTAVQGTFGYMDPEYYQSSQFTDKSDVYSFGVMLTELLTGETPYSYAKDEGNNLVACFISLAKENQLFQILDPLVAREAKEDDVHAIGELTVACLRLNGKKRPTMKQVSMELEGLCKSHRCLQIDQESHVLGDMASEMHATFDTIQEPMEQSICSSSEMESGSI